MEDLEEKGTGKGGSDGKWWQPSPPTKPPPCRKRTLETETETVSVKRLKAKLCTAPDDETTGDEPPMSLPPHEPQPEATIPAAFIDKKDKKQQHPWNSNDWASSSEESAWGQWKSDGRGDGYGSYDYDYEPEQADPEHW